MSPEPLSLERLATVEASLHMLEQRIGREIERIDDKIAHIVQEDIRRSGLTAVDVDRRFVEHANRDLETHATIERLFKSSIDSVSQTLSVAVDTVYKNVSEAKDANEKRFASVNEFRAQQTELITKFPLTDTVNAKLDAVQEKINSLSSRLDRNEAKGQGLNAGWGYLVGFIGIVIMIGGFLLNFAHSTFSTVNTNPASNPVHTDSENKSR